MVLTCAFADTWGSSEEPVDPHNLKRSNFNVVIAYSWHSLACCALFGYVMYWHFFQKKDSIGAGFNQAKVFEGLLGVDGGMGSLVGCLKGRVGGRNATIGDLDVCFRALGVSG